MRYYKQIISSPFLPSAHLVGLSGEIVANVNILLIKWICETYFLKSPNWLKSDGDVNLSINRLSTLFKVWITHHQTWSSPINAWKLSMQWLGNCTHHILFRSHIINHNLLWLIWWLFKGMTIECHNVFSYTLEWFLTPQSYLLTILFPYNPFNKVNIFRLI